MDIKKPIFIIGTGRCGSTIFHRLFSRHPNFAWLSPLCDRFPDKPWINRLLMRAIDLPLLQTPLFNRIKPGEAYNLWDYYVKGFSTPCRDLRSDDVSVKNRHVINKFLSKLLTKKRNRLLVKITGWPRITYLKGCFPDAKFIHVIRDGRAVANSILNVSFWWGWRGPQNWRWGELSREYNQEWEDHQRSFVALAAIQWKILMDATEETKKSIPADDFLEIKYEDLCDDPLTTFKTAAEFSELDWTPKFEKEIKKQKIKNTNHKWQAELTEGQKTILNQVLSRHLVKYGYE